MALDPMNNDDIRKEMDELSPHLPPKQPEMPPAGYFDSIPERVIQRWKANEEKINHHRVIIRRWTAIAAMCIGVMVAGWWLFGKSDASTFTPVLTVSSSEAYQYVMDNISDFDGLMEQQVQWPLEEKIIVPDSSAAEEFLLEELQGHEIEQMF
jgi:hypothetical protein